MYQLFADWIELNFLIYLTFSTKGILQMDINIWHIEVVCLCNRRLKKRKVKVHPRTVKQQAQHQKMKKRRQKPILNQTTKQTKKHHHLTVPQQKLKKNLIIKNQHIQKTTQKIAQQTLKEKANLMKILIHRKNVLQ